MKIIRRMISGLFSPRELIDGMVDKRIVTAVYFFILAILLFLPWAISIITIDLFAYEDRVQIRQQFVSSSEIPFYIENNTLYHDNDDKEYVYEKVLSDLTTVYITLNNDFTPPIPQTNPAVIIQEDGVYYYSAMLKVNVFTYDQYDLNGIDFSDARTKSSPFWPRVFSVIEDISDSNETEIKVMMSVVMFFTTAFGLIFVTLIIALFQKFFSVMNLIRFSKLWQLIIYAATPYVFGRLISDIYGLALAYYAGFIMMIVSSVVISREIIKRGGKNEF